jgi:hypothetical protein
VVMLYVYYMICVLGFENDAGGLQTQVPKLMAVFDKLRLQCAPAVTPRPCCSMPWQPLEDPGRCAEGVSARVQSRRSKPWRMMLP